MFESRTRRQLKNSEVTRIPSRGVGNVGGGEKCHRVGTTRRGVRPSKVSRDADLGKVGTIPEILGARRKEKGSLRIGEDKTLSDSERTRGAQRFANQSVRIYIYSYPSPGCPSAAPLAKAEYGLSSSYLRQPKQRKKPDVWSEQDWRHVDLCQGATCPGGGPSSSGRGAAFEANWGSCRALSALPQTSCAKFEHHFVILPTVKVRTC